ncbi:helix-turn-helix transcriptional regulator [Streptomyces hirsutus]
MRRTPWCRCRSRNRTYTTPCWWCSRAACSPALTALFEQAWQNPLPIHGFTARPAGLPPADRRLLRLLAGGATDDVITRELGISRRTLLRRLQILMARLGAANRFQMALQAQRSGWL